MSLKEALLAEQTRKREAEEAARRPYEAAFAELKALHQQVMAKLMENGGVVADDLK